MELSYLFHTKWIMGIIEFGQRILLQQVFPRVLSQIKAQMELLSSIKDLNFRMLRRYRKIKEDSRLSAAEDRGLVIRVERNK